MLGRPFAWYDAGMARLVVCAKCSRHVRSHEATCPFCGAETHGSAGRGAGSLVVASIVLASLAGCGGTQPPPAESPTEIKVMPVEDKGEPTDTEADAVPEEPAPEEPVPVEGPPDQPDPGPVMMYASPPR